MAWFDKEFISFLSDLEKNNNREWFQANKKRYENSVKEPFLDFVTEMISRIQKDDPLVAIAPKDAIFRINRDIRFSKDKRPYKTAVSAVISPGGRKNFSTPGIYFEFKASGVQFYGGAHHLEKDQLFKMRMAIMKNGTEFLKIIKAKDFIEKFNELLGEKNKRLTPEFADAAVKEPFLFNKNFYFGTKRDAKLLLQDQLIDELFELYKAAKPFNMFVRKILS